MLAKAKKNNKEKGITGCIVYCNEQFIQLIAGPADAIEVLYSTIKNDDRHYNVTTLLEKKSNTTLWDDWSMAFYNFSGGPEVNKHSRILMEAFFERVDNTKRSSEVYKTLRQEISNLLNQEFGPI
jgi:hypothetical protein